MNTVRHLQKNSKGVIVLIKKLHVTIAITALALALSFILYFVLEKKRDEADKLSNYISEIKINLHLLTMFYKPPTEKKQVEPKIRYKLIYNEIDVVELLESLGLHYRNDEILSKEILEIRVKFFKEEKYSSNKKYAETLAYIKEMETKFLETNYDFHVDMRYLANYFTFLQSGNQIISDENRGSSVFSNHLKNKILAVDSEIKSHLEEDRIRVVIMTVIILFLVTVIIFFTITQVRRMELLNLKVKKNNEMLEQNLKKRTKEIETEKNESEKLLKSLLIVQKRIFTLINNIDGCLYEYDLEKNKVSFISSGLKQIWGLTKEQVLGGDELRSSIYDGDREHYYLSLEEAINSNKTSNIEYRINNSNDELVWVREIATPLMSNTEPNKLACVCYNITAFKEAAIEKEKMKSELIQSQKLESVGQLAAGIAHEINTPAQFISDNLTFLQESVEEVLELFQAICERVDEDRDSAISRDLRALISNVDMPYLIREIPSALFQSHEGIISVSKIVRAMKDYAHPEKSFKSVNINMSIESTIIISSSEWKYVSVIEKLFDTNLPMIECVAGDINQVILNIIVNSAHSIEEKYHDSNEIKGKITVETKQLEDNIIIKVRDNGNGMTEDTRNKVFDQFFTTKEVGKGTGQGMSIAYRLIVEKHQGCIEIQSTVGIGSLFTVTLPLIQTRAT